MRDSATDIHAKSQIKLSSQINLNKETSQSELTPLITV